MGFWQGINEGLTYSLEAKARKQERQQELDLRKQDMEIRRQERAEDRAFAKEDFKLQIAEKNRETLFGLYVKREQEKSEVAALSGKANMFLGRLEGVDDPRVAALAKDPRTAAELEDQLKSIEIEAAKNDVDLPPMQGEALLDLLTVYDSKSDSVAPVGVTFEDLLSGDFSNQDTYYQTAAALSTPAPRVSATINAEAYRLRDPKKLEEGRRAFDQEVLRAANERLAEVKDDPTASSELQGLMEGYAKEGSAERFALMDMFGQQAFASLASAGNPYIQNLEEDPTLSRYSAMWQLQGVLNDPEATEEEKAKAQELLGRFQ
jgi:hypothetical protein